MTVSFDRVHTAKKQRMLRAQWKKEAEAEHRRQKFKAQEDPAAERKRQKAIEAIAAIAAARVAMER